MELYYIILMKSIFIIIGLVSATAFVLQKTTYSGEGCTKDTEIFQEYIEIGACLPFRNAWFTNDTDSLHVTWVSFTEDGCHGEEIYPAVYPLDQCIPKDGGIPAITLTLIDSFPEIKPTEYTAITYTSKDCDPSTMIDVSQLGPFCYGRQFPSCINNVTHIYSCSDDQCLKSCNAQLPGISCSPLVGTNLYQTISC
eukprot:TRINITY_DN5545_c0_g2_i1.p1 TRINITY_DN5545_c0_g2~~TRINITY_DN5545_c0_g2_i1.p1  ORF type:complete len:196 (+),score=25.14 TRINITY_DN5545_c0_g2_i1:31-618(+)